MNLMLLSKDRKQYKNSRILIADRVFDGFNLHENAAVIYKNNRVIEVGPHDQLSKKCKKRKRFELGDATIFPGFIESHAHTSFRNVSNETIFGSLNLTLILIHIFLEVFLHLYFVFLFYELHF